MQDYEDHEPLYVNLAQPCQDGAQLDQADQQVQPNLAPLPAQDGTQLDQADQQVQPPQPNLAPLPVPQNPQAPQIYQNVPAAILVQTDNRRRSFRSNKGQPPKRLGWD